MRIMMRRKKKIWKCRPCPHSRIRGQCIDCGGFDTWARILIGVSKQRARRDNLLHSLDKGWIAEQLKEGCPVFKVPFDSTGSRQRFTPFAASIDRYDSSKGYTKDNVFVISLLANMIKTSATTAQVRAVYKWMKQIDIQNEKLQVESSQ